MNDSEVIYDPVRCETHIGEHLVIPDVMLAEMGLSIKDLLEQIKR